MSTCSKCGAELNDGDFFCQNCGATIEQSTPVNAIPESQPVYQQPVYQQPVYQQPVYQQPYQQTLPVRAPHYDNGGLIAWAIITLLLCTIPGIVALVKASKINGPVTQEEQTKLIADTKTWCLVGTILGVLALIGTLIAGNM